MDYSGWLVIDTAGMLKKTFDTKYNLWGECGVSEKVFQ
jgi:hypothetical protein